MRSFGVFNAAALTAVRTFRRQLYASLGLRQDSAFDLLDSALSSPERRTLVRLSLNPAFRRRWSSTCDALADGSLQPSALRRLFMQSLPIPEGRPFWVIDGTHWPRPRAATSPERTCEWHPVAGQPQHHLVPAWAYQWLVAVPESDGSWVLPLDVPRRDAAAGTPTAVAIQQLRSARARQPAAASRPVVVLDSGYDASQLAQADLDVDCLVRLAQHRVFFRAQAGIGAVDGHSCMAPGSVCEMRAPSIDPPARRPPITPSTATCESTPGPSSTCGPHPRPA